VFRFVSRLPRCVDDSATPVNEINTSRRRHRFAITAPVELTPSSEMLSRARCNTRCRLPRRQAMPEKGCS
jgi:hypothetical protein